MKNKEKDYKALVEKRKISSNKLVIITGTSGSGKEAISL